MVRVVDGEAVRALLPMPDAIAAVREAFRRLGDGAVEQPPRTWVRLEQMGARVGLMPAHTGDAAVVKVVSVVAGNSARDLPGIHGFVAVLDGATGQVRGLVSGAAVTALRTAAASGLATDLLADPAAEDVGIIGAGVQGRAHLEAVAAVRDVQRVRVFNRTTERAAAFAEWAASLGVEATVAATPAEAARGAQVVCVCTDAPEPLLTAADVADGAHVNAIGAFTADTRELATDLVVRARVVVDVTASAWEEAGDLLIPLREGAIDRDHVLADLVDLVAGRAEVAWRPDAVTLFKSVGVTAEDAVTAEWVLDRAVAQDRGVEVPF